MNYDQNLSSFSGSLDSNWDVVDVVSSELTWRRFCNKNCELAAYGWKIHLSLLFSESHAVFFDILAFLIQEGITFKVPKRSYDYYLINSGKIGQTQIGKIITVYPANNDRISDLLVDIEMIAGNQLNGPVIRSEFRLNTNSCVYFRYGVFHQKTSFDVWGRPYNHYLYNNNRFKDSRELFTKNCKIVYPTRSKRDTRGSV